MIRFERPPVLRLRLRTRERVLAIVLGLVILAWAALDLVAAPILAYRDQLRAERSALTSAISTGQTLMAAADSINAAYEAMTARPLETETAAMDADDVLAVISATEPFGVGLQTVSPRYGGRDDTSLLVAVDIIGTPQSIVRYLDAVVSQTSCHIASAALARTAAGGPNAVRATVTLSLGGAQ